MTYLSNISSIDLFGQIWSSPTLAVLNPLQSGFSKFIGDGSIIFNIHMSLKATYINIEVFFVETNTISSFIWNGFQNEFGSLIIKGNQPSGVLICFLPNCTHPLLYLRFICQHCASPFPYPL